MTIKAALSLACLLSSLSFSALAGSSPDTKHNLTTLKCKHECKKAHRATKKDANHREVVQKCITECKDKAAK